MTDLETKLAEALRWMISEATDWEDGEIGVGHRFRNKAREALAAYEAAKAEKPNKDMDWHLESGEMDP